MSQTMNAVEITKPGGPEVLQMTQRPCRRRVWARS